MHSAAKNNKITAIGYLHIESANIDARDIDGNTPLHEAVRSGYIGSIKALL